MPVYWYSIPAQIKCVLDKFYSFCVAGKDVAGKGYGLIAACEENRHGCVCWDPDSSGQVC